MRSEETSLLFTFDVIIDAISESYFFWLLLDLSVKKW